MLNLIRKNFSLDLRSLALFRVLVATLLIIDFLFTRLPYFTLFYTERGIIPLSYLTGSDTSSLNFIFHSFGYQLALFILAILCFVMLLVGYKTKWAIIGTWVLYVSVNARNPLLINYGNITMNLMLFWALCLPLNKYFSIDNAFTKSKQEANSVFSINSFAFISQILLIFYFTYLLKTDEIWNNGQAVYYTLMIDELRTPWGDVLLQYPSIMQLFTHLGSVIESLIPTLFILFGFWWPLRMVIIFIMCGFHLLYGAFIYIGLLHWIITIWWIALIPSEFWEKIKTFSIPGNWLYKKISSNRQKLNHLLPGFQSNTPRPNKVLSFLSSVFFFCCFIYVLMWNVRTTDFEHYSKYMPPETWNQIGFFLHLNQNWTPVVPTLPPSNNWIILSATQLNGKKIDLLREGKPTVTNEPPDSGMKLPVFRLKRMLYYLIFFNELQQYYINYLTYLCNRWNEKLIRSGERIQNIEFIYMKQLAPPFGEKISEPEKIIVYNQICQ